MKKILFFIFLFQTSLFAQDLEKAYFAGGCFWCMEESFEKFDGVSKVISGYSGGSTENPTYEEVTYSNTGHFETIEIIYDKNITSFNKILDHFWINIDPFDAVGQFCESTDKFVTINNFQELKENDYVAICDVGAYGMSLSSNYNLRTKPLEILIKGNRIEIIRKRQKHKDLI